MLHHIEGFDDANSLADLDWLYELGVRSMGFVWNFDNSLAHCNLSPDKGLTELGKAFVIRMQEKGMLVDTAHMSHQSMMDVLSCATKPILNSHSNLMHFYQHSRNVQESFLDALKDNGGVLGLSVYKGFIKGVNMSVGIQDYLDQVEYVIKRIGQEHVALGTDFHGLPVKQCLDGLNHISQLQDLEKAMLERFGEQVTEQFFSGNVLRVLKANLPVE